MFSKGKTVETQEVMELFQYFYSVFMRWRNVINSHLQKCEQLQRLRKKII